VKFGWQGWFVAHQCIETAKTRECEWWLTAWAGAQFRANEAEALALREIETDLIDGLLNALEHNRQVVDRELVQGQR
jgi:hypothetical protein